MNKIHNEIAEITDKLYELISDSLRKKNKEISNAFNDEFLEGLLSRCGSKEVKRIKYISSAIQLSKEKDIYLKDFQTEIISNK